MPRDEPMNSDARGDLVRVISNENKLHFQHFVTGRIAPPVSISASTHLATYQKAVPVVHTRGKTTTVDH